jgi:hypothetical protein
MRATLHDRAPNTYYGQWPGGKAAVCGLQSPAIAHNERVARAGVVAFDGAERDFPGNRPPARWKNLCVDQKKNLRAGAVFGSVGSARAGDADPAYAAKGNAWKPLRAASTQMEPRRGSI